MPKNLNRRGFLKKSLLASTGAAIALSFEEQALLAYSGSKPEPAEPVAPASAGELSQGKIGQLKISRLICGGNLTSGFAHDRDLIYVSSLLQAYFTDEKIYQTWQLCEETGINTAILRVDNQVLRLIDTYWRERGGELQWIAQCKLAEADPGIDIKRAIDNGARAVYLHGGVADGLVEAGRLDLMDKALEVGRASGVPVGVAGHSIEVPRVCEKAGLDIDFYMKTYHSSDYWSYNPDQIDFSPFHVSSKKAHDNVWDTKPEETRAFMQKVKKPWIAYKVLAAGAIEAQEGLDYAYAGGADFVCLGMFDFQVRENAMIARQALQENQKRKRPWGA